MKKTTISIFGKTMLAISLIGGTNILQCSIETPADQTKKMHKLNKYLAPSNQYMQRPEGRALNVGLGATLLILALKPFYPEAPFGKAAIPAGFGFGMFVYLFDKLANKI